MNSRPFLGLLLAGVCLGLPGCSRPFVPDQLPEDVLVLSNPVISGFAPDPSIVRVNDDFYMVNSSFEYFPALPVYHSADLVNWELVGHAVSEPGFAELGDVDSSGGVQAATIRHHDGLFYVVTTNIVHGRSVSFIVTAADPRGPWSQPVILEDAIGIDPSLFFDDDGRAWYTANRMPPDPEYPGQTEIWLQELDLKNMKLIGERRFLWRGCCHGVWAEGPHIFKREGVYYLLISEGGTSYEHAISIAVSDAIEGPYRNNPRNPVLTHRHLSYDHPITGVGHADLVQLADGRWYGVVLGWRLIDGKHGMLGRETFLCPVTWEAEREWWKDDKRTYPVFSPESGKIDLNYPLPFAGRMQLPRRPFVDDFDGGKLRLEWNFRRAPAQPFYSLVDRPGALRIRLQPAAIEEKSQYSFVGLRQKDFEFVAATDLSFTPAGDTEEAGLVVIQNDRAALIFTLSSDGGGYHVTLSKLLNGQRTVVGDMAVAGPDVQLRIEGDKLNYRFSVSDDNGAPRQLGDAVDATFMSPAVLRGFNYTGLYIGLYGSSNGVPTTSHADFRRFAYQPLGDRNSWYER